MTPYREAFLRAAAAQILRVWKTVRSGGPLAADEQRLAAVLLAHPEWQRHWDGSGGAADAGGADPARNPFLHVHLHYLLEQQASERKPAEVSGFLDAAGGRHGGRDDRMHRLVPVLWSSLAESLRDGSPFDMKAYAARVRALGVDKK